MYEKRTNRDLPSFAASVLVSLATETRVTRDELKVRQYFKAKYLFLSFGVGIALMFAFSALVNFIGGEDAAIRIALLPGAILAAGFGYGGHDLGGLLTFMLGNVIF